MAKVGFVFVILWGFSVYLATDMIRDNNCTNKNQKEITRFSTIHRMGISIINFNIIINNNAKYTTKSDSANK